MSQNNGAVVMKMAGKSSNIPVAVETHDDRLNIVKWGKKNLYPYFLNYLAKNNPIHSGMLRAKRYFTVAGGLGYEGADVVAWNKFFDNDKVFHNDKNLGDIMWDMSLNFEKSNMFCYKIKMNALDGTLRKVEEVPFTRIRFEIEKNKDNKDILTGKIKVSNNWSEGSDSAIQILEPYNPRRHGVGVKDPQRMFYVLHKEESGESLDDPNSKIINPGLYPDPPYGGAITSIDTGIEINKFNNAEAYNNFNLGTVLNLNNGAPGNEEKREELKKKIQKEATGSSNAGGIMIIMNNGKEREASILSLNGNDLPDRYLNTKKASEASTGHGHSVTSPTLFGVQTEGSFNAAEMETSFLIMQASYFTARRNALLSVLNWIGKTVAGLQGEIIFGEVELPIVKDVVEPAFTVNIGDKEKNEKKFSKEEEDVILSRLKEMGTDKADFKVVFSEPIKDYDNVSADDCIESFRKTAFQDLSDNQIQTLNLINDGNGFNTIRKSLDISGTELAGIYKTLQGLGLISDVGELLDLGALEVAASDIGKLEVLFEYKKRANAPALLPGGESREFCQTLLRLDRLYTREEINLISGAEGYNVFAYRGGWYHNPSADRNEPGCRHEWNQVVTFVK